MDMKGMLFVTQFGMSFIRFCLLVKLDTEAIL